MQQLLLRLPGWRLRQDGRGLESVRSFRSTKEARTFVGDVCFSFRNIRAFMAPEE